jgi:replication-associated recombination protein RarA
MESLVEKYRPLRIQDFIGIETPRKILTAFAKRPYSASFLLVGPSGLGKTCLGLALAREIGAEVHHLASRQCDLESVQELVRKCHYAPMFSTNGSGWHVCLVDESDQASKAAQHSFLSVLDTTGVIEQSVFVFTANSTANLEDRFLSRCRKLTFTTEGLLEPAAALLDRVWRAEGGKKAKTPDFAAIVTAARFNIRECLMVLETELLAPGTFKPPEPAAQVIHAIAPSDGRKIVDPARRAAALRAWETMRARRTVNAI